MRKYNVIVECDFANYRHYRRLLKRYKLVWTGAEFMGKISARAYDNLLSFCRKNALKCHLANSFGKRSNNYRDVYFSHNGPFVNNKYICAYCGRLYLRQNITIDHLFPVAKANTSIKLQKCMKFIGMKSVNDPMNLVAACKDCNKKKGTNVGIWIIRGIIGRNYFLWKIRYAIRFLGFVLIILIIAKLII